MADKMAMLLMSNFSPEVGVRRKEDPVINMITEKRYENVLGVQSMLVMSKQTLEIRVEAKKMKSSDVIILY